MEIIDLGNVAECKIDTNGYKYWYLNGKLHRTDGPAIERANGYKSWYVNGKEYSKEEFDVVKEVLWAI